MENIFETFFFEDKKFFFPLKFYFQLIFCPLKFKLWKNCKFYCKKLQKKNKKLQIFKIAIIDDIILYIISGYKIKRNKTIITSYYINLWSRSKKKKFSSTFSLKIEKNFKFIVDKFLHKKKTHFLSQMDFKFLKNYWNSIALLYFLFITFFLSVMQIIEGIFLCTLFQRFHLNLFNDILNLCGI